MCGRIIVDYDENMAVAGNTELSSWMQGIPDGAESSWNLSPTQAVPVAYTSPKSGEKHFDLAYWSMVPTWSKTLKLKYPTFNARSETVSEKPTFKGSLAEKRCVIPVSGFYEWEGSKEARVPHAIFGPLKVLPLAGLYSWWRDPAAPEGEGWQMTTTILTRASAGVMESLHDRMPVFLDDEILHVWLDPKVTGDQLLVDAASELAVPYSDRLTEYRVKPLRGNGRALIEPA